MSLKSLSVRIACALVVAQGLLPVDAYAVGPGLTFGFPEGLVPGALNHPVLANSEDLTYHDCMNFVAPGVFVERGYFWVSSYQDIDSVVDSQLNHFLANGYRKYATYGYEGEQCRADEMCTMGKTRLTYELTDANIRLILDPLSDTTITIANCQVIVANNGDDIPLGGATHLEEGQKTETDDIINGDFEIVWDNWAFTPAGQALYLDQNGNPLPSHRFVYNGNVTRLRGPLGNDHRPEGSGNFFWLP